MSNATVSRLGQDSKAGDAQALFLKVFAGEVLTAFNETTIMADKQKVRNITSGKSAQFPVTGKIGAEYHTPGAEIVGTQVTHTEKVISIDGLLISHAFIAEIDEAMNHYEVRSEYSHQMGEKLAKLWDQHSMIELVKTARASANISGETGAGTQITDANFGSGTLATKASALATGLFSAAEALDGNDVPEDDRFCVLAPAEYYALVQNTDAINRDWGGQGAYSDGKIFRVAGINILKSNLIPGRGSDAAAIEAGTGLFANHTVDTDDAGNNPIIYGMVWHPSAIGTVKLMDLALESEWDIRRQGTLMVAKYAMGIGGLRPECAVELRTAAPA
nr:phage capsid protein [Deltaproteobacteria bacterium]